VELHPGPMTLPIACGDSLAGCCTPPDQMQKLLAAGQKYKAYRHWDRIGIGRSQQDITGNGFNAIRFDPRKPAQTVRRMDSNWGMGGAMHWSECRRILRSVTVAAYLACFPNAWEMMQLFCVPQSCKRRNLRVHSRRAEIRTTYNLIHR
jgi:hypothetical protein